MRSRAPAGFPWVWMALLSGVALLVVVVIDLQRSVRNRGEEAQSADRRVLEAGVREWRRQMLDPGLLETVDPDQRFTWQADGIWDVPADLGWVDPSEPEPLPAIVQEKVAQTRQLEAQITTLADDASTEESAPSQADRVETLQALWQRIAEDVALNAEQRARIALMAAWQAHRLGADPQVETWLARAQPDAFPRLAASKLLLQVTRDPRRDVQAEPLFARLELGQAEALGARLADLGLDTTAWIATAKRQANRRVQLRTLQSAPPPSETQSAQWKRLDAATWALFLPAQRSGAWLPTSEVAARTEAITGCQLSTIGAPLADGIQSAELIPGLARLTLTSSQDPGWFQGALAWALLIAGLAGMCGGAAWLALRAASREAQAANLRGEFLTTVTHELKTPLAGIRLVSELLADDHVKDPGRRQKYLGALSAESTRLSMLIENVLDLRRMERGERAHDARPENLTELVRDTVVLFEPLLVKEGVSLRWGPFEEDLHVLIDRDDLRQALLNLLDNARKYGAGGPIRLALEIRGPHAILSVGDEGPGIPASERETIFDRFTRGSQHRDGGIPGVGIGLNLARAILRRQGGDLVALPPPGGRGAYFEMILPLVPASSPQATRQKSKRS